MVAVLPRAHGIRWRIRHLARFREAPGGLSIAEGAAGAGPRFSHTPGIIDVVAEGDRPVFRVLKRREYDDLAGRGKVALLRIQVILPSRAACPNLISAVGSSMAWVYHPCSTPSWNSK
jgi:hypothetical protein